MNKAAHSGFIIQRRSSPEVQNRAISSPTKRTYVVQKYFLKYYLNVWGSVPEREHEHELVRDEEREQEHERDAGKRELERDAGKHESEREGERESERVCAHALCCAPSGGRLERVCYRTPSVHSGSLCSVCG